MAVRLYMDVMHAPVYIDPITSDIKILQENGYTPEVITRMVLNRIHFIGQTATTSDRREIFFSKSKKSNDEVGNDILVYAGSENLPNFEIPGTKLPYGIVVETLRDYFHLESTHIGGQIVFAWEDRFKSVQERRLQTSVQWTRGRESSSSDLPLTGVAGQNLDSNIHELAEKVLYKKDPYFLALYIYDYEHHAAEALKIIERSDWNKVTADHQSKVQNLWGVILAKLDRSEEAIDHYSKAIALDSRQIAAYNNLGVALNALGYREDAIAQYHKAIALDPTYIESQKNLGHVFVRDVLDNNGDVDAAIAQLYRVIELDPTFDDAYANLVFLLEERRNRQGLDVESFYQSVKLNRQDAYTYANLGKSFINHNPDTAIILCNKAIAIDSRQASAYTNRGDAFAVKGDRLMAIHDYRKAIELNPRDFNNFYKLGESLAFEKDYNGAIKNFNRVIELQPANGVAYDRLATVLRETGDFSGAIKNYQMVIKLNPSNDSAYFSLGSVYEAKGDLREAIESYRKAIQLDEFPESEPERYVALAKAFAKDGQLNEAIKTVKQALAIADFKNDLKVLLADLEKRRYSLRKPHAEFRKFNHPENRVFVAA